MHAGWMSMSQRLHIAFLSVFMQQLEWSHTCLTCMHLSYTRHNGFKKPTRETRATADTSPSKMVPSTPGGKPIETIPFCCCFCTSCSLIVFTNACTLDAQHTVSHKAISLFFLSCVASHRLLQKPATWCNPTHRSFVVCYVLFCADCY